jgi:hypothetical protein
LLTLNRRRANTTLVQTRETFIDDAVDDDDNSAGSIRHHDTICSDSSDDDEETESMSSEGDVVEPLLPVAGHRVLLIGGIHKGKRGTFQSLDKDRTTIFVS